MVEINEKYIIESTVSDSDTAIAHKSGGLPVYATPAMIGLMEAAAYNLLKAPRLPREIFALSILRL